MCASEAADGPPARRLGLLLLLFLALRGMSLAWFRPLHADVETFFFPFAYLQGHGLYPFLDYWLEYPPVLAWWLVGLRALLAALLGTGHVAWQAAAFLHAVQAGAVVWEGASLALVYLLARRLRGPRAAVQACGVYLALFATAFVALSYLDNLPAFLLLAALALLAHSRAVWAGAVLGVGLMSKVLPAVLLPVALKAEGRRARRACVVGAFALAAGAIAAPFLATGKPWLWCAAQAAVRRPPWQTVWALVQGHYEFGYVGPLPTDQRPGFFERYGVSDEARALLLSLPPPVYSRSAPCPEDAGQYAQVNRALLARDPRFRALFYSVASHFATDVSFVRPAGAYAWVYPAVCVAVLGFYLVTFARLPAALDPRRRVTFGAFTVVLAFLCLKGWSPQFVAYLIPVLLIVFPVGEAAMWCLGLSLTAFLEMPVWAVYVHPLASLPGHPALSALDPLVLQVAVVGRTVLLVVVAGRLYRRLSAG